MQRQSLGSPGAKVPPSGGGEVEEVKPEKRIRCGARADRSIHLIPLLTLLCLLVLYLFSHHPSPEEFEAFGGAALRHDLKGIPGAESVSAIRGLKTAATAEGGRGEGLRNRKLGVGGVRT